MLPKTHIGFTEKLLRATNSESMYILWATVPDIDMFNFHRYTYHQISSFDKLFSIYGDKQQDKKTVALVLLGHLYLDVLSGPVKCFKGINFVCNPIFFNGLNGNYFEGINKVFTIIHDTDKGFQDKICNIYNKLQEDNKETYIAVMFDRLLEINIGIINIEKEIQTLHNFLGTPVYKNITDIEYRSTYNNFIQLEMQVNQTIIDL